MPDLIETLKDKPQGFDLFQALSLLERAHPDRAPIGSSVGLDEAVRLAAHVDFAFAASDINGVEESKRRGPPLTVRTSAMTLAGATGPLPIPFTELLMERRRAGDRAGLDFLDIFNQRLLAFLYRARQKHHLSLNGHGPLDEAALLRCLDALSGLGRAEGARGPYGERGWLRHAGLQGPAPRSMTSLLALLRDRTGIRFDGRQFVGAWHPLADDERARLASRRGPMGTRLGMGAGLGDRAWDQEAGIELSTPPLAHSQFASLLPARFAWPVPDHFAAMMPKKRAHGLIDWLVGRHLQRSVQVVLKPAVAEAPPTYLGECRAVPAMLGLSAWLSSPRRRRGTKVDPRWAPQTPRFVLRPDEEAHGN